MTKFKFPTSTLAQSGLRTEPIERLDALIQRHIAEDRYPGCQVALAHHGKLVFERTYGHARITAVNSGTGGSVPSNSGTGSEQLANQDTLWLLYSNTKVIIAMALWKLFEEGVFRFTDRVSDHLSGFAEHGKRDITVLQVITHQGGFPNAVMPTEGWLDHAKMRAAVCNFSLEWTPGSKVVYHGLSAHWVLACLIEHWTGKDFRQYIKDAIITPLALEHELFIGLPESADARVSTMYEPKADAPRRMAPLADSNNSTWRRAGAPGGGAYGTARAMVALYQLMLNGGDLNGVRLFSPRTLSYAIRNHTGERVDEYMGMPMHRGLGPHLRGNTASIRGLGAIASPTTFGHGGVGSSYCWADPESGLAFAYLTNNRVPDPWHSQRLDVVSSLVHSAII